MLPILYRDSGFIAADKPTGLLVHPTRIAAGERTSCVSLLREQLGREVFPVHRLDRAASGALLFALDRDSASELTRLFRERAVHKTYYAIVRGWVAEAGTIDKPLRKDKDSEYRPAVSRFERVATAELPYAVGRYATARYSLVRVMTETGRLHQVRRHLRSVFHPILGDRVYGDGRHNRFGLEVLGVERLLLLAKELEFTHPRTGSPLRIEVPWPRDFLALFGRFGWNIR
ncbi:MAG: pseudouridine synthase [Oligoflexia bacterium]|nr:pseudouridine synthase [Oligoflexia bacterium]